MNENGIMELWVREARLFKYGSGTGSNFSRVRGEGEKLSGGGKSSGLMSFLKIGDRAAGAIKSGGTTRRAAKMVIVDVDHPDIEDFINWKVLEEQKVAALVAGSKACAKHLTAIMKACVNCEGEGDDCFDPAKNVALKREIKAARRAFVPDSYIQRVIQFARQGFKSIEFPSFDTDWEGEAYRTVGGQNSNNTVRVEDAFLRAVENDGEWALKARTVDKVTKRVKARDLMDRIAEAAWASADPGIQFHTTINDWHTCPASGPIRASNPCSEYMFLDDTACNLASLNLVSFRPRGDSSEAGIIDVKAFAHGCRLWTLVLEISVMMAQFPSKEIAQALLRVPHAWPWLCQSRRSPYGVGAWLRLRRGTRADGGGFGAHDGRVLCDLGGNGEGTGRLLRLWPERDRHASCHAESSEAAYGRANGYEQLSTRQCR